MTLDEGRLKDAERLIRFAMVGPLLHGRHQPILQPRRFQSILRRACCHQGQTVSNLLDSTKCCNLGPAQYPANTPPKTAVSRRLDAVYR